VVTTLVDSASTLSEVELVVALPSMTACVTLVTSESASVPPMATAPPAVASAVVVAVTAFFAVRSSEPPLTATELLSLTRVLAVLTTTLVATPASPGNVVGFGPPGVAFEVTVELAASVVLPPAVRTEAPRTSTAAADTAVIMPSGDRPLLLTSMSEVAPRVSVPEALMVP
jgi:hypothetical protein